MEEINNIITLIEENLFFTKVSKSKTLTESKSGKYIIEYAALPLDVETGNKRVYPSSEISPAIEKANKLVNNKELVLWCTADGHPPEEVPEPIKSSHRILNAWIEDGFVWVRAEVLETQAGKDLQALINLDVPIGTSIRGTGSVSGKRVANYTFLGSDFVGIPSTGLTVKPIILGKDSIVTESMDKKSLSNNYKHVEEQNNMDNTSIKEVKSLIAESIEAVRNSKSKIDRATELTLLESTLAKISNIDFSSSRLGAREIIQPIKEWLDLKEEVEGDDSSGEGETENDDLNLESMKKDKENLEKELEEARNKCKESEEETKKLKESLEKEKKARILLGSRLVESQEKLKDVSNFYTESRKSSKEYKDLYLSESVKITGLKTLQDTRIRDLKESMSKEARKTKTVIKHNVQLMKENQDLVKLCAATKLAAESLAEQLLK